MSAVESSHVEEWFTPKEAAAYSRFSAGTLANWRTERNSGKNPTAGPDFQKVGARIRYSRAAIDRFIESGEVAA